MEALDTCLATALKSNEESKSSIITTLNELESCVRTRKENIGVRFINDVKSTNRHNHASISKLGKAIEKAHGDKIQHSSLSNAQSIEDLANGTYETIVDHLERKGKHNIVRIAEDELSMYKLSSTSCAQTFEEIYCAADEIRQGNFSHALQWIEKNRGDLREFGSSLEFRLHALKFIAFLTGRDSQSASATSSKRVSLALAYARKFFPLFQNEHAKDICRLMAVTAFSDNVEASPYGSYVAWSEITLQVSEIYVRDRCRLLGIAYESPLEMVTNAGIIASPVMESLYNRFDAAGRSVNFSLPELPAEMPLPHKYRFHPVFVCPVQRGQIDTSESVIALVCGHVISSEALAGILPSRSRHVKCPICPATMLQTDVMPLRLNIEQL